jgi:hypothetical protein
LRFSFPLAEILNRLREALCDFIFGMIEPHPFVKQQLLGSSKRIEYCMG